MHKKLPFPKTYTLTPIFRLLLQFVSDRFVLLSLVSYAFGLALYIYEYLKYKVDPFRFLEWKLTQYYVNYFEHGFVKRGILGTLSQPFLQLWPNNELLPYVLIIALSGFFALTFFTVVSRAIVKLENKLPTSEQHKIQAFRAMIAIGAVGFAQLAYDVGRYDLPNILILMLSIYYILRSQFAPVVLLTMLGILNHEAYIFYGVPLICSVVLSKSFDRNISLRPAQLFITLTAPQSLRAWALILACATLAIIILSQGNPVELSNISAKRGLNAWDRGILEPYVGSSPVETLLVFLILFILYGWLYSFYRWNKRGPDLIFISTLCPILLFAMGIDIGRWITIIFFVVAVSVYVNIIAFGFTLQPGTFRRSWSLLFFALPIGPIGIETLFPYLQLLGKGLSRLMVLV